MTTEEGNKLIAEFMGYKVYEKRYPRNHGIGGGSMELPKEIILKNCRYHCSWNWLMPVVEKIEGKSIDLGISIVIKNEKCKVYRYKGSVYEYAITAHESEIKITSVWLAVIEFIQWYNKNNKP